LANKNQQWRGKTGGGNIGQRILFFYFRVGNVAIAYFAMSIVILFYLLFNYKATKNIFFYFRKRQHYNILKSITSTYLNHYLFGKALIDKFVFFAGRKNEYKVEVIGNENFMELANNKDKGAVMIHSHVGSSEIAGYVFSQKQKTINAIIYGGESPVFLEYRTKLLGEQNVKIIPVNDSFSHVFEVNNALRNNEFISMAADRVYDNSKNIQIEFMGGQVEFPIGPFQLAVKMKIPMLSFFVMQNGFKKYKCHVIKIDTDEVSNQTRLQSLAKKYAETLESIVSQYPLQWYNFHKFWL
jgi:predicted LPLAT superfamily acyltransferase